MRKLHTVFYSNCTILYPTNSAQKFTFSIAHAVHFLHILTNSHYFLFFLVVPIQMDVTQNQQRSGQSLIWDFSVNRNFVLFFFFPQWGLLSVLSKLCSGYLYSIQSLKSKAKAFDSVNHNKLENSSRDGNSRPRYLPPEKSVCRSRSNS